MMKIRMVKTKDSAPISRLMLELGYEAKAEMIREKIQEISRSEIDRAFVAVIDNRVIGCISCHVTPFFHIKGKIGRITGLAILKEFRHTGAGSRLLDAADGYFQSNGCSRVEVTSAYHRDDANAFYRNKGYHHEDWHFVKHYKE